MPHRLLVYLSLAAGALLLAMLGLGLYHGITAQHFERYYAPAAYTADMQKAAQALRQIITLDNLFAMAYGALFLVLGASHLKQAPHRAALGLTAAGAMLITVYLDFHENLHMLSMLQALNAGEAPPAEAIYHQSTFSMVKFHSSYFSLFLFGLILPRDTMLENLLKSSLLVTLPVVGVLVYTYDFTYPNPFGLLRYGLMLAGFFLFGWNSYARLRNH